MHLTLEEIVSCLSAETRGEIANRVVERISTDSRTLQPGECFVALKGPSFDGHHFCEQAEAAGASALIVSTPIESVRTIPQVIVPDTLVALGEIARLWRSKLSSCKVVTVAGSSGKTTVKEMAASILRRHFSTFATQGNLNNLIGVPLSLCALEEHHQAAVVEIGMNMPGELARLVEIAAPDCVALTNIGNAHVGMFGSLEGLYEAKAECLRYAAASATFVLNADNELSQRALQQYANGHRVILFGSSEKAHVRAHTISPMSPYGFSFILVVEGKGEAPVTLRTFGQHNISNALAAAAIGHFFDVPLGEIAEALSAFQSGLNRSEVENLGGIWIIKDYYNASPAAVEAALKGLRELAAPGRRYAVLGDMLELGELEEEYHERVGVVAARAGLEKLFAYGPRSRVTAHAASREGLDASHFEDIESLVSTLRQALRQGDVVLIKGSRLMKLERVYEMLKGALLSQEK